MLSRLAPEIPSCLLAQALEAAWQIGHHAARAQVLAALAPRMTDGLLPEALAAARQDPNAGNRAQILAVLAPQLPAGQSGQVWAEVLAAARQVSDEHALAGVLLALAPQVPASLLTEVLAIAGQITSNEDRLTALKELPPRLSPDQLGGLLAAARQAGSEYFGIQLLVALAPWLPEELLPDALDTAREAEEPFWRARALIAVASRLPAGQQVWDEALATVPAIAKLGNRTRIVTLIASDHPAGQWHQAAADVVAASWQTHGIIRELYLRGLAPWLPPDLLPEALAAAREMNDPAERALLLAALAPRLPAAQQQLAWSEALTVTLRVEESERLPVLETIIPQLPDSLIPAALAGARQMTSPPYRAKALAIVVGRLPPGERHQVADQAVTDARQANRADRLTEVAALLPADLRYQAWTEALAAAEQITDPYSRGRQLEKLAPLVPPGAFPQALAAVSSLTYEFLKGTALAALAPELPADLLAQAMSVARQTTDTVGQARALAALAPRLPDTQRQQVWSEVQASSGPDGGWSGLVADEILAALAPHLPADLVAEATAVARQIIDQGSDGQALVSLAPRLPAVLAADVLTVAPQMKLTYDLLPARLLAALAPRLPDSLQHQAWADALATEELMPDEHVRARRLSALVPALPAGLVPAALAAAGRLTSQSARALLLAALAPRLPGSRQQQAWTEILAGAAAADQQKREEILTILAGSIVGMPHPQACALLREIFQLRSHCPRHELLADLRVVLAQPLGTVNGILEGIAEAVTSVSNWWP